MSARAMPELETYSVMVVDDTPSNIDLLLEILGEDYDVRVAVDGPSALEDMAADPPDIVLLDIMMPKMDGYEVCTRLKAHSSTRDIPVIFVTAKGAVGDEVRGFDCGAVDYITKPISAPVVKARVAAHLALSQASRILAERNLALEENIQLREDVERISHHDLKTPLNKIISLPRILMGDDAINHNHKDCLKRIEQAGLTMLEMINRSLDLVKMERGTYALEPVAVDLFGVLERVASDLRVPAKEKGCVFNLETRHVSHRAPGLLVLGDELLCYCIAANLFKNALEACPKNTQIMVEVNQGEGTAQFSVGNTGMVPEAVRDCFFEKYATAGKKGGTGLGTYSAQLMARTMGGDIAMTTGPDLGTRITVTLPLAKDIVIPGVPAAFEDDGSEIALPDLRVLVADDDPDNLRILAAYLDHPGLDIKTAGNGRQAFDLWKSSCHDLVFMDMEMPVMDGMTAVRQIRQAEARQPKRGRGTGVFALSAHGEAMAQTCLDAGCDGYLTKPVTREALLKVIQAWAAIEPEVRTGSLNSKGPPCPDTVAIDRDLKDIIPAFMENKAGQIRELLHAVTIEDLEGVRRIAHKLKGGFNMYGMASLGTVCADLEQAAVRADKERIPRLAEAVAHRFREMKIVYR